MGCTLDKPAGQIAGSGCWTGRQGCHSEEPQQAGELGWRRLHEVQQRHMWSPTTRTRLMTEQREALLKETWANWTWFSNAPSQQWRQLIARCALLVRAKQAGLEKRLFPVFSTYEIVSGILCQILGFPARQTLTYCKDSCVFILKTLAKSQQHRWKKIGLI